MKIIKLNRLDFLPLTEGLSAVIHSVGYYNKPALLYPYERNKKSTAYIKNLFEKNYHYFMGSLNGGKVKDFMKLSEVCSKNIHEDLKNGIIAIYHDESYLNKYLKEQQMFYVSYRMLTKKE